ncbi:MAG: TolC family protein [Cyclobacteriaceae bacterium]|nr:TolC family protein [Cyclobacteriaceae bacterium]
MEVLRKIFIIYLFVFPTLVEAQTLENYIQEAQESNPKLQSSYKQFEAALEKINQVGALPSPTLSFGYFISPVETRVGPQQAKLSLSQQFPWFGTQQAMEDLASIEAKVKYQEFINLQNLISYDVQQAYYNVFEVVQHLKWQQENIKLLETYKQLATSAFSNSKGALTDVLRTEIEIKSTKTDIVLLQKALKPLTITFNRLLNRPDSSSILMKDSILISNFQETSNFRNLLNNHPSILTIAHREEIEKQRQQVIKKQGLPQIGAGIDYVFVGKRTDNIVAGNGTDILMPMVSLSLPIYRKKYKAAIRESELLNEAHLLSKTDIQNSLISNYNQVIYQMQQAITLYELYNEQITTTNQMVKLLLSAYKNSGKDFEDILIAQQKLIKYEISKVTALKNYHIGQAKLNYLLSNTVLN